MARPMFASDSMACEFEVSLPSPPFCSAWVPASDYSSAEKPSYKGRRHNRSNRLHRLRGIWVLMHAADASHWAKGVHETAKHDGTAVPGNEGVQVRVLDCSSLASWARIVDLVFSSLLPEEAEGHAANIEAELQHSNHLPRLLQHTCLGAALEYVMHESDFEGHCGPSRGLLACHQEWNPNFDIESSYPSVLRHPFSEELSLASVL